MFAQLPRRRRAISIALLSSLPVVAAAQGGFVAEGHDWYGLMQKPRNVETRTFGSFSIDLPKDWQLVPGHGGTLFLVAERARGNEGRALVLEYMQLQAAFDPSIVEAVARVELGDLQAREPVGRAFSQQIYRQQGKVVIITQYDRPGLFGGTDHVVQYTIPAGTTMYRLVGITPSDQIDKAQELFAHVAASFRPAQ